MKTNLCSIARVPQIAGQRIAFEPPPTASRTQPNLRIQRNYSTAVSKLDCLSTLLDQAVVADGLEMKALHRAWKVLSNNCDVLTMVFPEQATLQSHDIFRLLNPGPAQYEACSIWLTGDTTVGPARAAGAHIDSSTMMAELPDQSNQLVERTERLSAWMDLTAHVLRRSRPMTASEHKLAAKALWADVE